MDRYDSLILDIIQTHKLKSEEKQKIHLRKLEQVFWTKVESDSDLSIGQGRVGERIANLYVDGLIENKNGYGLTRKGRVELSTLEGATA